MKIAITLPPTPSQITALKAAGPGAIVCHPRARGRGVKDVEQRLRKAGIPHRMLRTFGWSATGPEPQPEPSITESPEPEDTLVDGEVEVDERFVFDG